jgi:hypothetical protein
MTRGLILVHPYNGHHFDGIVCFDIFGELPEDLKYFGYMDRDCPYVEEEGRSDYCRSEDFQVNDRGAAKLNRKVMEAISRLISEGFEVKFVGWEESTGPRWWCLKEAGG